MMGAGKTTVAKKLAQELNFSFVDTDIVIEQEQGCSISQIFSYNSEDFFRDLETKVLRRYIGQQNLVLATGGGAVIREENFNIMRKIGLIIYLYSDIESLTERLAASKSRPLLGKDINTRLKTIFKEREQLYNKADFTVSTVNLSFKKVVERICSHLSAVNT